MADSLCEKSVTEFSSDLASAAPVPGGGGAAAVVGALAAALGSMVGNLTIGKKKYVQNEPRLRELGDRAEELRTELLAQVEADAHAFEPLSRAYGIPKDTPGREEELEACLHTASEPPMAILRLSCEVVALAEEYARLGSRLMISDAGCSAALAVAAVKAAALNVRVNTRLMRDRTFADGLDRETDELLAHTLPLGERVYNQVADQLS